jgi:hypothetical protein
VSRGVVKKIGVVEGDDVLAAYARLRQSVIKGSNAALARASLRSSLDIENAKPSQLIVTKVWGPFCQRLSFYCYREGFSALVRVRDLRESKSNR